MQGKIMKIKKFVEENNFKDLGNFLDWFYKKLNINYFKERKNFKYYKFDICIIDSGINI